MPKILIVGNEEFEFPLENENAGWGESVTDWATSVSDALLTVQQPNDITRSTAAILNNIAAPTAIPGFLFDTSEVISINSEYIITRTTVSPANNLVESGTIQGNYNGTDWSITVDSINNAGVTFDITSGGQVTYTSTNITGSSYAGQIIFRAKVFNEDE